MSAPLDLDAIKVDLAAQAPGMLDPDNLTWTRLSLECGALRLGGPDGIVYSASGIANIDLCGPDRDARDRALEFISKAPARLAAVVTELERLRGVVADCADLLERDGATTTARRLREGHSPYVTAMPPLRPVEKPWRL